MAYTLDSSQWKWYTYDWYTYMIFWEQYPYTDDIYYWEIYQSFSSLDASSLSLWDWAFCRIWHITSDSPWHSAYVSIQLQWYRNWTWETLYVVTDSNYNFSTWVPRTFAFWAFCDAHTVNSTMTDYRMRVLVWASGRWSDEFSILDAPYVNPWISVDASSTWKSLIVDWSVVQTAYWKTFNREPPYSQSWWNSERRASWESSFNLTNFQIWNEVLCFALTLKAWSATDWEVVDTTMRVQKYKDWARVSQGTWSHSWTYTYQAWLIYSYSWYMWIDKDEIWNDATQYRLYRSREWDRGHWDYTYTYFTVSNLNIDTTPCPSWYLWVEWDNLCYTDNTLREVWLDWYGYKHKIWVQSWFMDYVWTDKAWYIRLQSWWNYPDRIHYIDSSWYHRATQNPLWWYGWYATVSGAEWYVWGWDRNAQYWYGYLCYIDSNWTKHRIMCPDLS